ncbi:glycosyltransferase family 2 protein [Acidovorax sp. MR-S7]|uniref:glycosyltransferase family 2 protein n=1 Tax=Acidovorax sp. MR-S7 TaxID=1268622 RepID=UPI0003A6D6F4|nr:glycosyltransferase [Acidovorax sp. MR-S7]GAD20699.1 glycosyl transferase family 2 [Acidovorax sp. MR-S7]
MAAAQAWADPPAVAQALCLAATQTPGQGIGVLVINYNTACQTLRCLESIQQSSVLPDWVLVLDNASALSDYEQLLQGAKAPNAGVLHIYRSEQNLGFAEGSNVLIDLLLQQPECQYVMLLNSDAVAHKDMLVTLQGALKSAGAEAGLAGGRMHKLADPAQVDTLGLALYASLMPTDRKALDDIYLGPTGGCCMLTRALVDRLKVVSGYCFDPRFFCYCEDADLVMRAVLLGYRPLYLNQLLALHEGQASSGGGYNAFIAYHGLRNTLWMHIKLVPAEIFWRHGLLLLLAHGLMVGRHLMSGRFSLVLRVYRDALRRSSEFMVERKKFQCHIKNNVSMLGSRITRKFYRKGYLRLLLRQCSIISNFLGKRV